MDFTRKHGFKIAVLALCAAMGLYLYLSSTKEAAPKLDQDKPAPSFKLTSIDGEEVSLENTNGKVRVVYFYFANCPDICPPTTFLMTQVQDKLKEQGAFGSDVEFLSVTFDPERDTPDAIRKFIGKIPSEIDQNGWKFLRGDSEEETKKLMLDFGLGLLKDEKTGLYTHSDTITFIDRQGKIRKYMTGSIDETMTPDRIVAVVDALVDE
ncbi:SCO family protein [Paenibacillus oenotherae]|uniref:SCO family protein n=1 Tax=Paenibacillus oenotherae TaxID=1435645 RepID=A0ABS7D387_9BACL|nr:SCO family protein [Paenibacillus oenotherae]MBW7474394.1 SCO family protein [Paenibacillus oenotherae]